MYIGTSVKKIYFLISLVESFHLMKQSFSRSILVELFFTEMCTILSSNQNFAGTVFCYLLKFHFCLVRNCLLAAIPLWPLCKELYELLDFQSVAKRYLVSPHDYGNAQGEFYPTSERFTSCHVYCLLALPHQ